MRKILSTLVLVISLIFLVSVYALSVYASAEAQDTNQNDLATISEDELPPAQEPTIEQIIAEKKANDKPKSIVDKEGKKDKDLVAKVKGMKPNDKIRVAIWINADNIAEIKRSEIDAGTTDQIDKNIKEKANKRSADITTKGKPVKDHLKSKNVNISYESRYAPLVFAELTKADIQELESRDDVVALDLGRTYEPMLYNSVPTVMAPYVWGSIAGGATVAVVEPDGIAFANPYLKDGLYYNPASPNIGSHATGIAGIIASTHGTYRGVAYKGPAVLSGNSVTWADSDLIAATEWAMDNGAHVLSNSWGSYTNGVLSAIGKYYDYIVANGPHYPTVVFASGNCATCVVADPAIAYNVIAVGSFDDKNTGWMWGDDIMSSFSSYLNPASSHGSRDKPEVVAVGSHISDVTGITSTTIASPWIGSIGGGTSYAAPEVSGEVSLLMSKSVSLEIWPEAVKAIAMTSSDHNIEGNSRISDRDGVGGINILEAYRVTNKGRGIGWDGLYLAYNSGNPWIGPNITASAGQRVRVAIVWDSSSTGYGGSDTLAQDLDLYIERLSGTTWVSESRTGYSTSFDNNFELVEFNAPSSTKYRARVTKYRWDNQNSGTYLGYAAYVK